MAWQDEQQVSAAQFGMIDCETLVPVRFVIPHGVPETSLPGARFAIEWRLSASAQLVGVDYRCQFDVPLYRVPEGPADQIEPNLASHPLAQTAPDSLLSDAGITKTQLSAGGVRLAFTACRRKALALGCTGLLGLLVYITWLLYAWDAPLLFTIAIGATTLLAAKAVLDLWCYRSVVEATSDGLSICGGLFGVGKTHYLRNSEIDGFDLDDSRSSDTFFSADITVDAVDGRSFTIAKGIPNVLVERQILAALNYALGRSLSEGLSDRFHMFGPGGEEYLEASDGPSTGS